MICPKCGSEVTDGSAFCTKCGAALGTNNQQNYTQPEGGMPQGEQQANENAQSQSQGNPNPNAQFNAQGNPYMNNQGFQQNYAGGMPPYGAPYVDPKDHTAEFTPQDISNHKVFAMLPYLLGTIGIIIALLAAKDSDYIMFHVREALKLTVCAVLVGIVSAILCWTVIVPIAGGVCAIIILVVKIICFFQVCSGKAKEAAIVSSFGFLH